MISLIYCQTLFKYPCQVLCSEFPWRQFSHSFLCACDRHMHTITAQSLHHALYKIWTHTHNVVHTTHTCGRVPSTSCGMSSLEYPIPLSPLTTPISCMYCLMVSARISPASSSLARLVSAPAKKKFSHHKNMYYYISLFIHLAGELLRGVSLGRVEQ